MVKIGLLSDTHGDLDQRIFHYFKDVDEIWHAGDIGSLKVIDLLRGFKPLRAVYGNIDGHEIRKEVPLYERFTVEQVEVLMTHIAGKPGKYLPQVRSEIQKQTPKLFICGHSHILLVKYDSNFNMLHMNPGACGDKGFHTIKTLLRFCITGERIHDLEVIEIKRR